MRKFLILALFAMPLAACGPRLTNVNSVSSVATASADDLYTAGSAAGEKLVKQGRLDKATFQAADARAYAVLLQVRAGTATITDLNAAIAAITGAPK